MIAEANDDLRQLRLRYQAAYHAYQDCMIAIVLAGNRPAQELLDQQITAFHALAATRYAYGKALVQFCVDNDDGKAKWNL
jgi:hypothetical protein